jgi:hypothetical protein
MAVHSPLMLAIGIGACWLGVVLWRWAGRHSIDLKGAAISSAYAAAKGRSVPTLPGQLKSHIDAVSAETSNIGRAKVVGGSVARHFVAKVATMASLASIVGGVVMIALSVLWK